MSFEYKKYTSLYTQTLEDIINGVPIIVHEGGTSSSKTYSIMQALLMLTFYDPGCIITVVAEDIPNLKRGPIRDLGYIFSDEPLLKNKFSYNKTDRILKNNENESVIEFNSYDDEQDAKQGKRDYGFLTEANGERYEVFEQLRVRTKKTFLIDFNPSASFWAHDKILPNKAMRKWYRSNYTHNEFIPEKMKRDILSYEPTPENIARGTANKYRWQVYGLGQVGRLEGLVFPDFQISTQWPEDPKWTVYGLDFGFTNDPTSLVEICLSGGALHWRELIYDTGMTNPDIAKRFAQLDIERNTKIIADSAEPKSIEELKRAGFNVRPAEKGKDSITNGIDAIKRYPLYIYGKSKNLIEEFSSYTWAKDRNGNPTNKPIDAYNHGIDAGRYALMNKILRDRKTLTPELINI